MNFPKEKNNLKVLLRIITIVGLEILILIRSYSFNSSEEFKIKLQITKKYEKEKSNMEKFINQCLKGKIIQKSTNIVSNKTKITVYMLIYIVKNIYIIPYHQY